MNIKWKGAAVGNYRAGRHMVPQAVVIHLMDGSLSSCDNWFANPVAKVSAHYGIGNTGEIHQYVKEIDTAYHAGNILRPTWAGLLAGKNPNDYAIGIEHEGKPEDVWPEAQRAASAELLAGVCARWSIPMDRAHIVGHHEIFAAKVCPGPHADIDELIRRAVLLHGAHG